MKYDHIVKFNGKYYAAGQEVPIESSVFAEDKKRKEEEYPFSDSDIQFETKTNKYTYEELDQMPVREIKQMAENMGFSITKTIKEDIINEFLSKQ